MSELPLVPVGIATVAIAIGLFVVVAKVGHKPPKRNNNNNNKPNGKGNVKCSQCNKKFANKDGLRDHLAAVHRKK